MSFETAWGVPPPSLPTPDKGSAKRKRPSADPATKVESASINLEKLMGLMDKEAQQPKPPSGKDLKKAANKKDKPAPAGAPAQQQQQGGPAAKRQKQDRSAPTTGAQQQQQQPKEPRTDGKAEKGKGRGKNKAAKKANAAAAAAGATGGAAPAAAAAALPPHMDVDGPSTSTVPVIALKPLANASPAKPAAPAPPAQSPAAGGEQKKSKKAQKKERLAAAAAASGSTPAAAPAAAPSPAPAAKKAESKKNVVVLDDEPAPSGSAPAGPADSALTPMQLKMKRKLEGSRFRWINEQLYTTSSEDALDMMRKDPTVFSDYHVGFRSQTEGWPTSPVTLLTDKLSAAVSPGSLIIDLGCGDAALAKTLVPQGFKVLSYDLVGDAWVTECDYCTGIPLPGSEDVALGAAEDSRIVDGAVCCLSLMGRNWMQGVREIARVLQDGAVFEIAEVQSRMSSTDAFVEMITSLGFTLASKDDSNTHFILLSFVREGEPTWAADGATWEEVLRQGEEVLKACVYKKR